MYQNYLISAANCQVASYYWVLLAVCPCRSSSKDHALVRPRTTQTQTHTRSPSATWMIITSTLVLRACVGAGQRHARLHPCFLYALGKVGELLSCLGVHASPSTRQWHNAQMQIMRCPIKEKTICSFRCFPSLWNSSGCDFTAPPPLTLV